MSKRLAQRKGFTLVEVNLAIGIMAAGVLTMCALYSFGYRENRQSEEDVVATAYADAYLSPLIAALSSPQLKWEDWQKLGASGSVSRNDSGLNVCVPENGWADYIQRVSSDSEENDFKVVKNPKSIAASVFQKVASALSSSGVSISQPNLPPEYQYGLVVTRSGPVVQLAFRMGRRTEQLMNQPIFVTEVMFQGGWGRTE